MKSPRTSHKQRQKPSRTRRKILTRQAAGGAASTAGSNYQVRVAAWAAAHLLAEDPLPLAGINAVPATLLCQTDQTVDDILIETEKGGTLLFQAKRDVAFSLVAGSEFCKTLEQFVGQYTACDDRAADTLPVGRSLDSARDALILVTTRKSSASKVTALAQLLDRVRVLPPSRDLTAAATTANQRDVLHAISKGLRTIWRGHRAKPPASAELRGLLSVIHVLFLDVGPSERGESDAINLLRDRVLLHPQDAKPAWAALMQTTSELFELRGGTNRAQLQHRLSGFALRSAPSYLEDIGRIAAHSRENLFLLEPLGELDFAEEVIRIDRASTRALRQSVEEGSLVLVGEPGAGKSGTILALGQSLVKEGRDVVVLAADRITSETLTGLRQEFRLDHGLAEVLANWLGRTPAFLLIDALDAVRGEPAAKALRELIQLASKQAPRWRIVASIRRFDLRYSPELQDLFPSAAPAAEAPYLDPDFGGIRHFRVPLLDDGELAVVSDRAPLFKALLRVAPEPLRDLLRNPFNLRLTASLLSAGASARDLSPIKTQVALLDRFWVYRVLGDDGLADARENVLRAVCEGMVKSRRLRIERDRFRDTSFSQPLDALLSRQILSESTDRTVLSFSHHVLFDYATARLLLRGDGRLVQILQNDPALTLVVRPSLVLHFQDLWHQEPKRGGFWDEVLGVAKASVPETARLLGPTVAVSEARIFEDYRPLVDLLASAVPSEHEVAGQVLAHIVGAVVTWPPAVPASYWVYLLHALAKHASAATAYPIRALLSFLTDREAELPLADRTLLGDAAREVLAYLWGQTDADPYFVVFALQSVCRAADTNVKASVTLLRAGLEADHIRAVGDRELSWLARELPPFFSLDPGFARDVYIASFGNPITSTEPRPMGASRILPLVSNRGQDYRMALYQLGKSLPQFLSVAPLDAARAALSVVESHVRNERPTDIESTPEETFEFAGRIARVKMDYSSIWDAGSAVGGDAHSALIAFVGHINQLAERGDVNTIEAILGIVVSENRLAAIWRRLLLLGAKHPRTIGSMLRSLLWALPILTSYDCSVAAGDLIKATFNSLDAADRERIETAIFSIPKHLSGRDPEAVMHLRNRLIGCLSPEAIVSAEIAELQQQLAAKGELPENRPHFVIGPMTSSPYSEEDHLARLGVPVEAPANVSLRGLSKPAEEFAALHLNAEPDREATRGVFPALRRLHEGLRTAEGDGVHEEQSAQAWGHLLAAASQAARSSEIESDAELRAFVTDVVLAGSTHPRPAPRPDQDEQFDRFPSWGSPAPRVDAACGLVRLAWHQAAVTQPVLDALQRLARDPVPAVRFQIAVHVHGLARADTDAVWRLVDTFTEHETSSAILRGLVTGPLTWLARQAPDRAQQNLQRIWDRLATLLVSAEAREAIIELWASLYVWRGDGPSLAALRRVATEFPRTVDGLGRVPFILRDVLTYGKTDRPDPNADAIRRRAFEVFTLFLERVRDVFNALRTSTVPDEDNLTASARLLDHMAAELYFASGAFDDQRQGGREEKTEAERRRFFAESILTIESLATVPIPSLIHHLLETAESFISFEPERVFLMVCRILESGAASGYQYEGLAADLFVRIIERYLASYPTLFQQSETCRQKLLKALDTFVRVGWPSARRLTYRLDDILR
jgi:hypothetical protein